MTNSQTEPPKYDPELQQHKEPDPLQNHKDDSTNSLSGDKQKVKDELCYHKNTTYRSAGYWDCYDCGAHLFPWSLVRTEQDIVKWHQSQQDALLAELLEKLPEVYDNELNVSKFGDSAVFRQGVRWQYDNVARIINQKREEVSGE